jgi:hypothetical protein
MDYVLLCNLARPGYVRAVCMRLGSRLIDKGDFDKIRVNAHEMGWIS